MRFRFSEPFTGHSGFNFILPNMKISNATDIALLFLRLVPGGMMLIQHGWPKFMRFFAEDPIQFADPIGIGAIGSLVLAVFAELLCSLLVIVGLFTRLAVIPLIITMVVAAFIVHGDDPFSKMEFPILYMIIFMALGLLGPGQYSVDHQLIK